MSGEFRELFDGESLDGWFATGNLEGWAADDGAIRCEGLDPLSTTTYLVTAERFGDFDLRFEYQIEDGGNSGVYFRWSELTDRQTGMEIQILGTDRGDGITKGSTGGLYDMQEPAAAPAEPHPAWNDFRLRCDGPRIEVWINDEQTLDADIEEWDTPGENPDGTENKFTGYAMRDLPREGRIGLQDHGGHIRFRDVRVREL